VRSYRHVLARVLVLLVGAELVVGAGAVPALGTGSASEGTVLSAEQPRLSWRGSRLRRSVRRVGRCTRRTCRTFTFRVDDLHPQALLDVRIRWKNRRRNLDLYLYRDGARVASSTKRRSRSERVRLLDPAVGTYRALVVPRRTNRRGTSFRGRLNLAIPLIDANGLVADCTRDVSRALRTLIASLPDGGTLTFENEGCYRIDEPVKVVDRAGLTLDGNGATFRAMTEGDQDRRHFWFIGGSDITVRNLTVRGANPHAGTGDLAYQGKRAFQHGFAFHGVQGGLLENVQVYDVFGDFVYFGTDVRNKKHVPSRSIVVRDSHLERNGRQGIGIANAEDITIQNNHISQVRRATFDLEPNSPADVIRRISILDNTTGRGRLLWMASAGKGFNVNDITIAGNTMVARASGGILRLETPEGGMRGPFTIENNTFLIGGTDRPGFSFVRAHDVTVRNNQADLPAYRAMTAVGAYGANTVTVTGNAFTGARTVLFCNAASAGCTDSANAT